MCVVVITSLAYASPAKKAFWNGTPIDGMVQEMRSLCSEENDSFACMKYKVMNFLNTVMQKDSFKVNFIGKTFQSIMKLVKLIIK